MVGDDAGALPTPRRPHSSRVLCTLGSPTDGDVHRPVDGDGQDEAGVVVGVFADEVDPAWCTERTDRTVSEQGLELLGEVFGVGVDTAPGSLWS